MKYQKIFVVCPGNSVTGGPEAIHQLVHDARELGVNAYVSYHPFGTSFTCPAAYAHYNAPHALPEDREGNLVILSEKYTREAQDFKNAAVGIWWLSVDNYYAKTNGSLWRAVMSYIRSYRRRLSMKQLKN
jgi:hypothetical protein